MRKTIFALVFVSLLVSVGGGVAASLFSACTTDVIVETLVDEIVGQPGGLSVDSEGNIYTADFSVGGQTIHKITPAGVVSVFASGGGLNGLTGNTFDQAGNLYQSSYRGGTIHRITPAGVIELVTSAVSGPVGIAIHSSGDLLVADCNAQNIKRITPAGAVSIYATSALFACPNGVAIDEDDNLFVANFGNSNVLKVTPSGAVSLFAQLPGNNMGHMVYIGSGNFYALTRGGHQLYKIDSQGNATLLAGTGVRGHNDGLGGQAMFSLPNGLGISPDGETLYINESKSPTGTDTPVRIRKVKLNTIVDVQSLSIFRGFLTGGGLPELTTSDDQYLTVSAGITLFAGESPAQIVLDGTSPCEDPTQIRFELEAGVSTPGLLQTVDMFNFDTLLWEQVDFWTASPLDATVAIKVDTDSGRFVQSGTRLMRVRIKYDQVGLTLPWPWTVRLDRAVFSVVP